MNSQPRSLLERESGVEARNAVGVGGRDRKAPARVLQRAAADPAGVILHRMKNGQQEVAARSCCEAAVGKVIVTLHARPTLPQRFRCTEESVYRSHLLGCRRSPGGPYVQLLGRDRNQPV